jgi:hypothetical protein
MAKRGVGDASFGGYFKVVEEGKASFDVSELDRRNAITREFHIAIGSIFMHPIDFSLPPVSGLPTKI